MNRRTFFKRSIQFVVGALVASYPTFIERYIVLVNRYRVPVPNLPAAFAGFTIVHLTDLHYGLLTPLSLMRDLVDRANNLGGDVVVCTGDYVHQIFNTEEIDEVWPVLSGLRARSGVYSVLGNHDHWADTRRSLYWLEASGQNLQGRAVPLYRGDSTLWLAGVGDIWEDRVDLDGVLADVPLADCRIVLAHNPDTADIAYDAPVDLFVCGHTHGGQVRLPFVGAPVLPVRNKRYGSGLQQSPRSVPVFISRGIGWAVLPVRLNCYPEIAVLELVPGRSATARSAAERTSVSRLAQNR